MALTFKKSRRNKKAIEELDALATKATAEALRQTSELRKLAAQRRLTALVEVLNASEFVVLGLGDVETLAHDVAFSQGWRKHLYARCLAVVLVALAERANALGSRGMSIVLRNIEDGSVYLDRLRIHRKQLQRVINRDSRYLKELRNITIAHRDANTARQITLIEALDYGRLVRTATAAVRCGHALSLVLSLMENAVARKLLAGSVRPNKALEPLAPA